MATEPQPAPEPTPSSSSEDEPRGAAGAVPAAAVSRRRTWPLVVLAIVLSVVVLPGALGLAAFVHVLDGYARSAERAAATTGTVTAVTRSLADDSLCALDYEYVVDGVTYVGEGATWEDARNCAFAVGDPVKVTYDPAAPAQTWISGDYTSDARVVIPVSLGVAALALAGTIASTVALRRRSGRAPQRR